MENNSTNKAFARNLRACMERKNITRADLARSMDCGYMTVSDWYKGNKFPRLDRLQWLADYFGVTVPDLVNENGIDFDEIELRSKKTNICEVVQRMDDKHLRLLEQYIKILWKEN